MRTPLKDKTRTNKSTSFIKQVIPRESEVDTYLFYSGTQEINLCYSNRKINAHTNREVVYEFWSTLLEDSRRVERTVRDSILAYRGVHLSLLQCDWILEQDRWAKAALFFMLNRSSHTGLVSSGELDTSGIEPFALSYLRTFDEIENFTISYCEYEDTSSLFYESDSDYIFVPCSDYNYNLFEYGKNRGPEQPIVHHGRIRDRLRKIDQKWIVSYNYHKELRGFYDKENMVMIDTNGLITNSEDKCVEMLFLNFAFEH